MKEQQRFCFQRLLKNVNLDREYAEGVLTRLLHLNMVHQLHCCEEESPTTALKESQLPALEDIYSTRCLHSASTISSDLIHPC